MLLAKLCFTHGEHPVCRQALKFAPIIVCFAGFPLDCISAWSYFGKLVRTVHERKFVLTIKHYRCCVGLFVAVSWKALSMDQGRVHSTRQLAGSKRPGKFRTRRCLHPSSFESCSSSQKKIIRKLGGSRAVGKSHLFMRLACGFRNLHHSGPRSIVTLSFARHFCPPMRGDPFL